MTPLQPKTSQSAHTRNAVAAWMALSAGLAMLGAIADLGAAVGVMLGLPFMIGGMAICARLDRNGEMHLVRILLFATGLRWACATAVQLMIYSNSPGLFAPDENYYNQGARVLSEYFAGRVPNPFPELYAPGIVWVSAACFYLFGNLPLVPKFINGMLGGWTAVLAALIASRIYSAPVARRAGYLVAVFPSLVLWSSLNTKDCSALFGVELSIYAFFLIREKVTVTHLLLFVAAFVPVAANRAYEIVFVGIGVVGSFLFGTSRRPLRTFGLFVLVATISLVVVRLTGAGELPGGELSDSPMDAVSLMRSGYAMDASSAIDLTLIDTSTPLGLIAWIPFGLAYFMLSPIPLTGTSTISIATTPEMLVMYWLLPSLWRGLRDLVRTRFRLAAPLILYAAAASTTWSIAVTNVGTLFRYRSQVLFAFLILIAADQIRRREARVRKAFIPEPAELRRALSQATGRVA